MYIARKLSLLYLCLSSSPVESSVHVQSDRAERNNYLVGLDDLRA